MKRKQFFQHFLLALLCIALTACNNTVPSPIIVPDATPAASPTNTPQPSPNPSTAPSNTSADRRTDKDEKLIRALNAYPPMSMLDVPSTYGLEIAPVGQKLKSTKIKGVKGFDYTKGDIELTLKGYAEEPYAATMFVLCDGVPAPIRLKKTDKPSMSLDIVFRKTYEIVDEKTGIKEGSFDMGSFFLTPNFAHAKGDYGRIDVCLAFNFDQWKCVGGTFPILAILPEKTTPTGKIPIITPQPAYDWLLNPGNQIQMALLQPWLRAESQAPDAVKYSQKLSGKAVFELFTTNERYYGKTLRVAFFVDGKPYPAMNGSEVVDVSVGKAKMISKPLDLPSDGKPHSFFATVMCNLTEFDPASELGLPYEIYSTERYWITP